MLYLLTILSALSGAPGDFDVIFNEIHYHPFGNDPLDEFLELHNRGSLLVDLSGWRLSGGVVFAFPEKTFLPGGGYLVVGPDPENTSRRYGVPPERVVGPWTGHLDNAGATLVLENAAGSRIARIRYNDKGAWPTVPDGFGPSLELVSPRFDMDIPEKWAASARPGGTPGARNSRWFTGETSRETLVGPGQPLRFFRGRTEPTPADPLAWTRGGFDDSAWEAGPGPVGYGVVGLGITLDDMQGNYSSVYLRVPFEVSAEDLELLSRGEASFLATARYDDGFVAYFEGIEVSRINLPGAAGDPVAHDALAGRSEQAFASFDLAPVAARLRAGTNTLSLEVLNWSLDQSGDLLLDLTLERVRRSSNPAGAIEGPVLNEAASAGPEGGFIEVLNAAAGPLDVGGFRITRDPFDPASGYAFPALARLAPGELRAIREADLGFTIPAEEGRYILLDAGGEFVSGLDARLGPLATSFGLVPDGRGEGYTLSSPSPGEPNRVDLETSVVIDEIHYHPTEDPGDPAASGRLEFIELANRGPDKVVLAGWRFARGIDFTFPAGVEIPGGEYLVVAGDPAAVRARSGLPAEKVVGGFPSRLANDAETLRLEDPRGNPADEVRYADDGSWPAAADGQGPSLELVNLALDNRSGRSWKAGPPGGTPGAKSASYEPGPAPVVFDVHHLPAVPHTGQPILVTARVGAVAPLERVFVSYRTERGTGAGDIELRDDGLSGDGPAGDGVWGGTIPPPVPAAPRPPARVVFSVNAVDQATRTASFPGPGKSCLFEVDDQEITGNSQPRYRLIMTSANWNELRTRGDGSNVPLDATFIGDGTVVYNVGLHYRGQSSRNPPDGRMSYRVNFTDEERFHGIRKLNLNSQRIWSQTLGGDFVRRAGIPSPQVWPANLWIDGSLDPAYLRVETLDGDFLDRVFPSEDSGGNLYRGGRDGSQLPDLSFWGPGQDPYKRPYEKVSNEDAQDWSDVVHLCDVLSNTPDAQYPEAVGALVDVEEWCLYFAIYACLGSTETGIYNDDGDDYYLYHRPSDGRWMLFPWDRDSDFSTSEIVQALFRPTSPSVRRFLTRPEVAPVYYCVLQDLAGGPFSLREMESRYPLIADVGGPTAIAAAADYVVRRLDFIEKQVPVALAAGVTATGDPASGGELVKSGDGFRFFPGTADPPAGWMDPGFDDSGWTPGTTPIGQGYNPLGTAVEAQGNFTTLFARRTFQVPDPSKVEGLTLSIGYDDGFVAWLNGAEAARANLGAPGQPVSAVDRAAASHDGSPRESFPVDAGRLRTGDNVLAFALANSRIGSADLLLDPLLLTGESRDKAPGGGCGDRIQAVGGAVRIEGRAPGCETRSVRVNGQPAAFTPVGASFRIDLALAPGVGSITVEAFDLAGALSAKLDLQVDDVAGFRRVGGTLAGGGAWTRAEGPYYVAADLDVPAGERLTVGPGTVVLVAPGAAVLVHGEIDVEGDRDAPVQFQPINCGQTWGGIRLLSTGTGAGAPVHRIRNVAIIGVSGTAALEVRSARAEVSGVEFRDLLSPAIVAGDSVLLVEDSSFADVPGALIASLSAVTLRRSEVRAMGRSPAVSIEGDGPEASLLEEIDVASSLEAGVSLRNSGAVLKGSRIHDCGGPAVRTAGGSPSLSMDLLVRSSTGLSAQGGDLTLDHLTITENGLGIEAAGGAKVTVSSSIDWGNGADLRVAGGQVGFGHSDADAGAGEPPPGSGNIAADPLFATPGAYDLAPGSPAAGAGEGGSDMGAVASTETGPVFVRGDYVADGELNLTDVIVVLSYMFLAGEPGPCADAGDADDSGELDITDAVTILNFLFLAGPQPPLPFPDPGHDPTQDSLGCGN